MELCRPARVEDSAAPFGIPSTISMLQYVPFSGRPSSVAGTLTVYSSGAVWPGGITAKAGEKVIQRALDRGADPGSP
jgi:hypothetical protein